MEQQGEVKNGAGAGRRGSTVAPVCHLGGRGGASNTLRLKSQPLCPEHKVGGEGLGAFHLGGITAKNCPPTDGWLLGSGPSEMVHGQAQLSLREPRRGGGAAVTRWWGDSQQRSRGAASKSRTKYDMAFVFEPCISSLWGANLGRKI